MDRTGRYFLSIWLKTLMDLKKKKALINGTKNLANLLKSPWPKENG